MFIIRTSRFPLLSLLRSRPFVLSWIGQTVSFTGDNMFNIALAWQVLTLTHSATVMSTVMVCKLLPTIIFLLIGGAVADYFPLRRVMVYSDIIRACIVIILAIICFMHKIQIWHIIVLNILFGFVDSFFTPASRSILPLLADKDMLQAANSVKKLGDIMSGMVGPSLGALCVTFMGPASVFLCNGLSFIISAYCLAGIRLPSKKLSDVAEENRVRRPGLKKMFRDVREGLAYVAQSQWIWLTILSMTFCNIAYGGPISVSLPRLIYDGYGVGIWLLGAFSTSSTLGALTAAILLGQMPRLKRGGLVAYATLALNG